MDPIRAQTGSAAAFGGKTLVEGSSRPPSPGGNGENGRSRRRGCERPFRFETEVVCFYLAQLAGKFPAFFSHLLVSPVLEILEQYGLDDRATKAHTASLSGPDEATFGLEDGFAFRQQETYVDETGESHGVRETVESHAAGAEIDPLNLRLFTLRVSDGNGQLHASPEEFLLLEADDSEGRGVSRRAANVVILQLAAESAPRNAKLVNR